MSWNFAFIIVHIIIITNSQNFIYNGNYQLSQSNWEATCLFYYDRHLASIHNESERAEAQTTIGNTSWIGLSDSVAENTWIWTDMTAWNYGKTFFESPWCDGEPNNMLEEDCVIIFTTGCWNDNNCVNASHYGLCGYPSGFIVLNDKTNYVRIRGEGTLVGYIDILDEVFISFYITFQSWPAGLGNILHFGDDDTQRYPGIFIDGTSKYIHSSFGLISNDNPVHESASGYALNTEYLYTLYQTQKHLTITFAGVTVYDADTDSHPILMNRALYLGSPWHNTFSATFRNMHVSTSNSPESRFWNYLCDDDDGLSVWTPIRWTWNSGTYVYDAVDGDCSVQQTSATTQSRVAWIGTNDVRSLAWTDYKVEMIINIVSGLGNEAGIIIRANGANCSTQDCGQYYEVRFALDFVGLRKINNGVYSTIGTDYPITNTGNTPYLIRVEAIGSSFAVYENNVYLKTWTDTSDLFPSGSVGFLTYNVDARFSKMRITFPENQQWYTANPSSSPTKNPSNYPTFMPTTSNPSYPTTVPTTSDPTTAEPSYNPSSSTYPTTNPTTVPTTGPSNVPTATSTTVTTSNPTTSAKTTNNPTNTPTNDKKIEEIDMITTLIFGANEGESDVSGAKGGTATIIIVIVIVMILMLTGFVFFYFKKRKTKHKKQLETNTNNVQIGQIKGCESCDDDIVTQVNQTTDIGSIQKSYDDIVTQVNQTTIGIFGNNEKSDDDLIPAVNETQNNNEEEDLIQTINNTAGANEQMIEPGSNTMDMEVLGVNAIGEAEGVDYILDEDGAKEVRLWLDSIGFGMYYDIFVNNGFDSMESIQEIRDENDLSGIGLKLKGHQLKLLKYIKMSKTYHT